MKHYNVKTLAQTKAGWTDLFIVKYADAVVAGTYGDFVKNATTAITLTTLQPGDVVFRVMTEVITAVAGPTATLSAGITGSLTLFTTNADVATSTAVPYVAAVAAVTPWPVQSTAIAMTANTVISNTAVTAGEVWIWACISRKADRTIDA